MRKIEIDWTEPSPFDGGVPLTKDIVKAKKERLKVLRQELRDVVSEKPIPKKPQTIQFWLL